MLVALAAAAGSAGLGWLLAGRALRPLRILRDRTAALSGRPAPAERAALTAGPVRAAAETAELADALAGLLDRVEAARAEGEQALQAARDFAAAASHELRTPLTTLRTDLDVLGAHPDLPPDERAAVARRAARQPAAGRGDAHRARSARRGRPRRPRCRPCRRPRRSRRPGRRRGPARPRAVDLTAELPEGEVPVLGSEAGLRLAVDNLVTNAVRHSGGRRCW